MNRKLIKWTILAAVVIGFGAHAVPASFAQPAPTERSALPAAEQLLENYITVTGGRAAYEKLNNRVSTGSLEMPAAGIKASMKIVQAAPNKARVSMDIPGVGKVEQGCDGETVWENNVITGVRILEGAERETMLRQLKFNAELDWKSLYESAETVGIEDINGSPSYKVKLVTANDKSVMHNYYDKDTGLLTRIDMISKTQMGDLPVNIMISEYKEFDGIKMPMLAVQKLGAMEQSIRTESVEHNVDLPEDAFALPPEIKELKEKAMTPQPGQ